MLLFTPWMVTENSEGVGDLKAKILKWMYEAKLGFPDWWGGGGGGAPVKEVWIFYLTFTVQSPSTLKIIGKI